MTYLRYKISSGVFAESIYGLAASIGLPGWFVELRHDATHNQVRVDTLLSYSSSAYIYLCHYLSFYILSNCCHSQSYVSQCLTVSVHTSIYRRMYILYYLLLCLSIFVSIYVHVFFCGYLFGIQCVCHAFNKIFACSLFPYLRYLLWTCFELPLTDWYVYRWSYWFLCCWWSW